MKTTFDTYCGLSCAECKFKAEHQCNGCIMSEGNPFHGVCAVAACAKSRGKRFCGECEDIPCDLLKKYAYDEQHGDNGGRIENCQKIKASLVSDARIGINPVSFCGHHCDYCFLGQWCGGCRSDYNCCSFAGLYGDNKCPNVVCASGRNLTGCYECQDLLDCNKGYYGVENEYIAKATALFIQKYGEELYTTALKRAIAAGMEYPTDFDHAGSVEKALELLEKHT